MCLGLHTCMQLFVTQFELLMCVMSICTLIQTYICVMCRFNIVETINTEEIADN
jgi:hypothetical protein